MLRNDSTIAAIATAQAAGGIGIIRISGEKALSVADKVFFGINGKKLNTSKGYRAYFGKVLDGDEVLDECVATVFRAPHSYTGEDVVELSCHGGLYILKRVLRAVLNQGAVPAQAGEFTQRAFLNGKMDLTQAQAVMDLISAHGRQAAQAAVCALDGALSREIKKNCDLLISGAASLSAWVDYPDEDIEELSEEELSKSLQEVYQALQALIGRFDAGRAVTQGVTTAIVGRPNVGKSTLMNLLSGCTRSIVTEYAGTTRDVVEDTVQLGDVVLHLADTAGIRESDNPVENIGVKIAKDKMEQATLIIAVFDGSQTLEKEDYGILEKCRDRLCVAVINKTDLNQRIDTDKIRAYIDNVVEISASTGAGSSALEKVISELLGTDKIDPSSAMLAGERQLQCCIKAADSVKEALDALKSGVTLDAVNVCMDSAIESLLELTGERVGEAVVNEVFSRFCVGK